MFRRLAVVTAALLAMPVLSAPAEERKVPACGEDSAFGWLDFWVGTWDVMDESGLAGTNEIRKILNGCAITEEWTGEAGRRGFSLFYFRPASRVWQQVWVTDRALGLGGVKEKSLTERLPNGGLQFQGEGTSPDGRAYLDRTTLEPVNADEVRQTIEISVDGGESWKPVFRATYLRRGRAIEGQ